MSTTTLRRAGTTSNRGTSRPAFYLQGNNALLRETPPSLRWTPPPKQWRTSCLNCGCDTLMSISPAETPSVPTLSRQNATVGNTRPSTTPAVSSYRGRFKTGSMLSSLKRYVWATVGLLGLPRFTCCAVATRSLAENIVCVD